MVRHASFRSVWFLNSLRGSLALAAAVLVAVVSGVQHGFWVVLGTLSVLRTNAACPPSRPSWRALGVVTVVGLAVGALLMFRYRDQHGRAVGGPAGRRVAGPAYAPGTLPFAFGQAAFTVVVVVLFNLLVPVGWKVGLLRIQDVALGCAVSLVVGVPFWPRGAGLGGRRRPGRRVPARLRYLAQAVAGAWARGLDLAGRGRCGRHSRTRLDEALRGFLAEQGAKRLSKQGPCGRW